MLVFVRPNSSYVRPKLKVIGQMSCQVKYLFAALDQYRVYKKTQPRRISKGNPLCSVAQKILAAWGFKIASNRIQGPKLQNY
jgi:hypothetical protein